MSVSVTAPNDCVSSNVMLLGLSHSKVYQGVCVCVGTYGLCGCMCMYYRSIACYKLSIRFQPFPQIHNNIQGYDGVTSIAKHPRY